MWITLNAIDFCLNTTYTILQFNSNVGNYNWTEVERHDTSDLKLQLRDLKAFTRYEVLIQALNDFGAGPVEIARARTESDGKPGNVIKLKILIHSADSTTTVGSDHRF